MMPDWFWWGFVVLLVVDIGLNVWVSILQRKLKRLLKQKEATP